MEKVSIIIRTKNEERWISSCLDSIYNQKYKDFEVIIVDNNSTDKTLDKAKKYPIKNILNIEKFFPGKALNIGIEKSIGKYIVCLSAHCIPVNNQWLSKLVSSIEENEDYAGVYGRQEPMSFSSISDKRDLMLIFGLDRKIQSKDSFFHNANSIIRKELWKEFPFSNKVTNIEDRIWAKEMLHEGKKILYEPEARVFHFHGIHQDGNQKRLQSVVQIIKESEGISEEGQLNPNKLNISAVVPVKGEPNFIGGIPLIKFTIDAIKKSKFIKNIIVSTDNEKLAEIAEKEGAKCPFLRPKKLSEKFVNLEQVQKFSLEQIEKKGILPDLILHLEETFPFRPPNMIDEMIKSLLKGGYDSIIAAKLEQSWIWQEKSNGILQRIDSGDVPREFKEKSLIGLHGIGVVTHPEFIRKGNIMGPKTFLYQIDNYPLASFEVRSETSKQLAEKLLTK